MRAGIIAIVALLALTSAQQRGFFSLLLVPDYNGASLTAELLET
jgi:hypothetical protein